MSLNGSSKRLTRFGKLFFGKEGKKYRGVLLGSLGKGAKTTRFGWLGDSKS